jgi:hypothetical protein
MKTSVKLILLTLLSALILAPIQAANPATPAEPATPTKPAPAKATAPAKFLLDHYKVYVIEPMDVEFKVWLRGQFDGNIWDLTKLYTYERFLNPADKNGEGIIDKHAHLNWYRTAQENLEPIRKIEVFNQFGLQTIKTDQPVAMLVPAEKIEPGSQFPANLDHYKVFRIISYDGFQPVPVVIKDQFGVEDNRALRPVYFAVPVEKRHNNGYYPINNREDHLVFYQLDPREWNEGRTTKDQFGALDMKTRYSELLGVPSQKLGWEE